MGIRSGLCRNSIGGGLFRSGNLDVRTGLALAGAWVCGPHPDVEAAKKHETVVAWLDLFCRAFLASYWGKSFQASPQFLASDSAFVHRCRDRFSFALVEYATIGLSPAIAYGRPSTGLRAAFRWLCQSTRHFSIRRFAPRRHSYPAIDWLREHATKGEKVLGLRELAILPAEWKRSPHSPPLSPGSKLSALLEHEQFDYFVTGEFDLRYAPDPDPRLPIAMLDEQTAPLPVQASFGEVVTQVVPYVWRTNDERILILRKKAANSLSDSFSASRAPIVTAGPFACLGSSWMTSIFSYPLAATTLRSESSVSQVAVGDSPLSGSSGPPSPWIFPRKPLAHIVASCSAAYCVQMKRCRALSAGSCSDQFPRLRQVI